MKRLIFIFAACVAMGMLAVSCAKNTEESVDVKRERSFDAWVQLYGAGAEKLSTGIYVKKLRASTDPAALTPKGKDTCWVKINYTGREMVTGDVYATRYPDIAKHQGTFAYYTNYIPDYLPCTPYASLFSTNFSLPVGVYYALQEMKEGDLWRVYIPANLAYGSSGYSSQGSGFGGQNVLGSNLPVTVDLELVKVVPSPTFYEIEQVQNYAAMVMKKSLADTIRRNVYLKQLQDSPDTTRVRADSTVKVYYVGRFLDGFVFDTNIKDTAVKHELARYYENTHYDQLEVTVAAASSSSSSTEPTTKSVVEGFNAALLNMRYGERAQVIFPASYAYGVMGNFPSGGTVIPPYTPLIFDIEIAPHYGDGTRKYPYTTYAVQHQLEDVNGVWVMGYVCGLVKGDNVSQWVYTLDDCTASGIKTNLMLGDGSWIQGADGYKQCFAAELPEGAIRNALNIPDNKGKVFHIRVKLFGDIRTYLGARGIVNVTDYKIE